MDSADIQALAQPLSSGDDLRPLLERVAGARFVLLGEASHGTHEYYAWRGAISRRLIADHGFRFVAVEGDWPDCYAVNRCVKQRRGAPAEPRDVLAGFDRWPTWMWANTDVLEFVTWLRGHNGASDGRSAGFYGLDVYSLWESMRSIIDYLSEHEPQHVETALQAYRCFEPYSEDPQEYAWATRLVPETCEDAVVSLLTELCAQTPEEADDEEARFDVEQNAAVAAGAERYYRSMIRGGGESWNIRDVHMADTLDRLMDRHGRDARGIVWAHNTHIGDARATDMAAAGMVNLGQLARERHGEQAVALVGFGGYRGSVVAGQRWGAPQQVMAVPPARSGSVEDRLHQAAASPSLFVFRNGQQPAWLRDRRDHRAIGVVYDPDAERYGNYVPTVLGARYDAFCFFDDTQALQPLETEEPSPAQEPETFPSGH